MDCPFPNIEKEMKKRNMDYRDLAKVIGVNDMQAYRRLRGKVNWKLEEAYRVCKYFDCDVYELFYKRG